MKKQSFRQHRGGLNESFSLVTNRLGEMCALTPVMTVRSQSCEPNFIEPWKQRDGHFSIRKGDKLAFKMEILQYIVSQEELSIKLVIKS